MLLLLLSAFLEVLLPSLLTFYYDALCLTLFLILFTYLSCFEKEWKVIREEGQKIAHHLSIKIERKLCPKIVHKKTQKLYVKGKKCM